MANNLSLALQFINNDENSCSLIDDARFLPIRLRRAVKVLIDQSLVSGSIVYSVWQLTLEVDLT